MSRFAQSATVTYIRQLGAVEVKQISDYLDGDGTPEGETARAALQAIVGRAGAAASSQACGAGALGAASSAVIGSLLGSAEGLSAQERQARENLVNSLVGAVATATSGGSGAATVAGAGQIEVENNQLAPQSSAPPPWLPGLVKLPGFTGETANKGDGVIADPATQLDPSLKAGTLVTPAGDPSLIDKIFAPVGDAVKGLVDSITTVVKGDNGSVPPSILGGSGKLPDGIGGVGTPIPMPPSEDPNAIAERFAKDAFNGQTPVRVVENVTGQGSWVAILPDGTAVTYRPAGQASSKTAETTATVEVNNSAIKAINDGEVAKFKFPSK